MLNVARAAAGMTLVAVFGTEEHPDTMALGGVKIEFRSAKNPESLVAEGLIGAWLDELAAERGSLDEAEVASAMARLQ